LGVLAYYGFPGGMISAQASFDQLRIGLSATSFGSVRFRYFVTSFRINEVARRKVSNSYFLSEIIAQ
jgi:hypothetical protein